ncbi:MAG: 23S rRNA (guanosine(2251)-2'-O)-methyltransferase RlmB [Clostridia bacterium]|nr:23S rRNA (guanosine(2251)-2'-O)-methyltransferase RlmB [Clostridia bacterium]
MIREDELIIGKNAVNEAIKAKRELDTVYVDRLNKSDIVQRLISRAKKNGAIIKTVDSKKLDFMCAHNNHQGIVAKASSFEYSSVDEILNFPKDKNNFVVICDGIEDPHNLGAIIRSAECMGADGVIIPERRSASVNFTVSKSSAGAVEYIKIARVKNLLNIVAELKDKGLWIYGADMKGDELSKTDLRGNVAIVIGSEGKGISRTMKEACDFLISIPLYGHIDSLNASVAAGIIFNEVAKQRKEGNYER